MISNNNNNNNNNKPLNEAEKELVLRVAATIMKEQSIMIEDLRNDTIMDYLVTETYKKLNNFMNNINIKTNR